MDKSGSEIVDIKIYKCLPPGYRFETPDGIKILVSVLYHLKENRTCTVFFIYKRNDGGRKEYFRVNSFVYNYSSDTNTLKIQFNDKKLIDTIFYSTNKTESNMDCLFTIVIQNRRRESFHVMFSMKFPFRRRNKYMMGKLLPQNYSENDGWMYTERCSEKPNSPNMSRLLISGSSPKECSNTEKIFRTQGYKRCRVSVGCIPNSANFDLVFPDDIGKTAFVPNDFKWCETIRACCTINCPPSSTKYSPRRIKKILEERNYKSDEIDRCFGNPVNSLLEMISFGCHKVTLCQRKGCNNISKKTCISDLCKKCCIAINSNKCQAHPEIKGEREEIERLLGRELMEIIGL